MGYEFNVHNDLNLRQPDGFLIIYSQGNGFEISKKYKKLLVVTPIQPGLLSTFKITNQKIRFWSINLVFYLSVSMSHLNLSINYSDDFKRTKTYLTTKSTATNPLLTRRDKKKVERTNLRYTNKTIHILNLKRVMSNTYFTEGCIFNILSEIFKRQYQLTNFFVTDDKKKHDYLFYCDDHYFIRKIPANQLDKNVEDYNRLISEHSTLQNISELFTPRKIFRQG